MCLILYKIDVTQPVRYFIVFSSIYFISSLPKTAFSQVIFYSLFNTFFRLFIYSSVTSVTDPYLTFFITSLITWLDLSVKSVSSLEMNLAYSSAVFPAIESSILRISQSKLIGSLSSSKRFFAISPLIFTINVLLWLMICWDAKNVNFSKF